MPITTRESDGNYEYQRLVSREADGNYEWLRAVTRESDGFYEWDLGGGDLYAIINSNLFRINADDPDDTSGVYGDKGSIVSARGRNAYAICKYRTGAMLVERAGNTYYFRYIPSISAPSVSQPAGSFSSSYPVEGVQEFNGKLYIQYVRNYRAPGDSRNTAYMRISEVTPALDGRAFVLGPHSQFRSGTTAGNLRPAGLTVYENEMYYSFSQASTLSVLLKVDSFDNPTAAVPGQLRSTSLGFRQGVIHGGIAGLDGKGIYMLRFVNVSRKELWLLNPADATDITGDYGKIGDIFSVRATDTYRRTDLAFL